MNISKITGYHHGRRLQRMTQDSYIRNTNRSDAATGAVALIGLLLPLVLIFMIFGLG